MVMMVMMSAPPALAHHDVGHDRSVENRGNTKYDGLDANQGGGQEHPKNERPPHGGGSV
jgi:hypothetical protein